MSELRLVVHLRDLLRLLRRRCWVLATLYQSAFASHDVAVACVGLVRRFLLWLVAHMPLLGSLGTGPNFGLSRLPLLLFQSFPLLLARFRLPGQYLLPPSLELPLLLQLCLLAPHLLLSPLCLPLLGLDRSLSTCHLALQVCQPLGQLIDLFSC